MATVTRALTNDGDPITYPDGSVAANKQITFQLVDFEKRQPVSLFDAATDGGEYIVGSVVSATVGETGYFTVNLWPNNRGELATLYKVLLPGTTIKPFYIQVAEGAGAQTLLSAKTAVDAVQPQTLSLFDALLANIISVVNTATALVTRTTNGLMSSQDKVKLDDLTAVDLTDYAPLDSPELTGTPLAPTAAVETDTTQIATTGFVQAVKGLITTALDLKAPKDAPSFTGILKSAGNALFGKTVDDGLAKVQSSNGITLGNSANASPLVLDWYEEGTWTPVLKFGNVDSNAAITSYAKFTRIGNFVTLTGSMTFTYAGTVSGGYTSIGGIPYTAAGGSNVAYTGTVLSNGLTGISGVLVASVTTSQFYLQVLLNGNITNLTSDNVTNTTALNFTVTYPVA